MNKNHEELLSNYGNFDFDSLKDICKQASSIEPISMPTYEYSESYLQQQKNIMEEPKFRKDMSEGMSSLVDYNKQMLEYNKAITTQLINMSCTLTSLNETAKLSSDINECYLADHSEKLDLIVDLINNPNNTSVMGKISEELQGVPAQLLILLITEGFKMAFGLNGQ